jgi:LmbE family N-acetylglucosaminyl deacetylase
MEDHMNTTRLALTAAFARGMPNFTTEPDKPAYPDPVAVYHALPYGLRDPLGEPVHAAFYTDVGNVLATKREMLACHRSQKEWLDVSQGLDAYLETMESMARDMGRRSGRFEYAEGWTQHLPLGYGPEDWDPLTAVLAAHCTAPARPRP